MNDQSPQLDDNVADKIVTATKLAASFIPFPVIGSIISELVGMLIPNQRIDRIADFVKKLDARLSGFEQAFLSQRMTSPEFVDLFEDGAFQAARTLSSIRRDAIAAFLANSLSQEELEHQRAKLLLNLLGEINDVELLLLKYYSLDLAGDGVQRSFWEQHKDAIQVDPVFLQAPQDVVDKATLQKAYKNRLERLGLLRLKFSKPRKGESPVIDLNTGMVKAKGYQITPLGRLLVRWIE